MIWFCLILLNFGFVWFGFASYCVGFDLHLVVGWDSRNSGKEGVLDHLLKTPWLSHTFLWLKVPQPKMYRFSTKNVPICH